MESWREGVYWFPGWSEEGAYNAQPSDDGLADEDCIELRRSFRLATKGSRTTTRLFWNDRNCHARNYFICQRSQHGVKRKRRKRGRKRRGGEGGRRDKGGKEEERKEEEETKERKEEEEMEDRKEEERKDEEETKKRKEDEEERKEEEEETRDGRGR
ncbi:hypothetical protein Pmani_014999 [Petrolisthes manimaculis]|uniref:C-type lectin domain-containing protein n=1 Tax=Petrolisthes manimaculis TaxID=1843537 RepID=A0AAE1PUT5_9EUCA|nr:hypothetical protein Pmani_014999 [Petrolisthes manimaculis]